MAYQLIENGRPAVYSVGIRSGPGGAAEPGIPKRLCEDCGFPTHFSSDSKAVLCWLAVGRGSKVGLVNLGSGERTEVTQHSEYALREGNFSPDNRWIAFVAAPGQIQTRLFLMPFRSGAATPESEWIEIAPHEAWDGKPRWSPDGNILYCFSDRDGFVCLWAQRLDPATKRPHQSPFAVQHLHRTRQSLRGLIGAPLKLAVHRDKLVFNLAQRSGNIWMAATGQQPT